MMCTTRCALHIEKEVGGGGSVLCECVMMCTTQCALHIEKEVGGGGGGGGGSVLCECVMMCTTQCALHIEKEVGGRGSVIQLLALSSSLARPYFWYKPPCEVGQIQILVLVINTTYMVHHEGRYLLHIL